MSTPFSSSVQHFGEIPVCWLPTATATDIGAKQWHTVAAVWTATKICLDHLLIQEPPVIATAEANYNWCRLCLPCRLVLRGYWYWESETWMVRIYALFASAHLYLTCTFICHYVSTIGEQLNEFSTIYSTLIYTVNHKKGHPFYFCNNLIKCWPNFTIFGRNVAEKICNVFVLCWSPHLFSVVTLPQENKVPFNYACTCESVPLTAAINSR